jgi:hypothetical protein
MIFSLLVREENLQESNGVTSYEIQHSTVAAVSTAQSNISNTLNQRNTTTSYTWRPEELQNSKIPEKAKPDSPRILEEAANYTS